MKTIRSSPVILGRLKSRSARISRPASSASMAAARAMRLGAQEGARHLEHRADRAQAPIVVQLLAGRRRVAAEQVTRQLVEREELERELARGGVALRHQHILHDHAEIGHHDRDGAEEDLERLGQLGTAEIARVHGDEGHAAGLSIEEGVDAVEAEAGRAARACRRAPHCGWCTRRAPPP